MRRVTTGEVGRAEELQTRPAGGLPRVHDAAPVLPDRYTAEARQCRERQIVLAEYRRADVLKETVSD
jgi:hypothetical protein